MSSPEHQWASCLRVPGPPLALLASVHWLHTAQSSMLPLQQPAIPRCICLSTSIRLKQQTSMKSRAPLGAAQRTYTQSTGEGSAAPKRTIALQVAFSTITSRRASACALLVLCWCLKFSRRWPIRGPQGQMLGNMQSKILNALKGDSAILHTASLSKPQLGEIKAGWHMAGQNPAASTCHPLAMHSCSKQHANRCVQNIRLITLRTGLLELLGEMIMPAAGS